MYFTQEKNKFESLHIIVTLIALFMHQIAHWQVIGYYELVVLFYILFLCTKFPPYTMKAIVVGLSGVKVYIVVGSVCCLLFFWLKKFQ